MWHTDSGSTTKQICPINGQIIPQGQRSLEAFFKENVGALNTARSFLLITERLSIFNRRKLFGKGIYWTLFFGIRRATAYPCLQDFKFKSFYGCYKFYNQYALKTNDLNTISWKVWTSGVSLNALPSTCQILLMKSSTQRYQPEGYPSFLNAGRARVAANWFPASSSKVTDDKWTNRLLHQLCPAIVPVSRRVGISPQQFCGKPERLSKVMRELRLALCLKLPGTAFYSTS